MVNPHLLRRALTALVEAMDHQAMDKIRIWVGIRMAGNSLPQATNNQATQAHHLSAREWPPPIL